LRLRVMSRPQNYWRNLTLFTCIVVMITTAFLVPWLGYTRALLLVHPVRLVPMNTPADVGISTWEEVTFLSTDGLLLSAWFIPPKSQANGATLIFVHGLGTHREHLLDEAAMLVAHGYGALLLDLRNHGKSAGALTTLGYAEVEDVRGAVAYLQSRAEVNPHCIALMGHSMGGATVIRAAARIPQVRAVIAASAFTSIEDNIAEGVRGLTGLPPFPFAPLIIWFGERETGMSINQMRPIDDVPLISPRAILFIHGQQDDLISASNSVRLFNAAREPKRLYLIPNAGHVGLLAANPREFERQVMEFLEMALARCNLTFHPNRV